MIAPFERLRVWQLSFDLVLDVYRVTAKFPPTERYGLSSQLRRAATAIPTNIAEGNARDHRCEYVQFYMIARGSLAETKCLTQLSHQLALITDDEYLTIKNECNHVGALLQGLICRLQDDVKKIRDKGIRG